MTRRVTNIELSVVVPAYLEASTISMSLKRLREELDGCGLNYEVVLVVDGNLDSTAEIAENLGWESLIVFQLENNHGKGYALKLGIAQSNASDFIAYIDADLDINPVAIKQTLPLLLSDSSISLCVGSKNLPTSKVYYPYYRKVLSFGFRTITRFLFNLAVRDTQTGFKIGRADDLRRITPAINDDGYTFDLELLIAFQHAGLKLKEIPVEINYDFSSSIKIATVIRMLKSMVKIKLTYLFK